MESLETITNSKDETFLNKIFITLPLCYQETEYTCGVASLQSILKYYGINYKQDKLAKILRSKPIVGTDFRNILWFAEKLGFETSFHCHMTVNDLKAYLHKGITPMLLIQAWSDEKGNYQNDWNDNHYVVACGYHQDIIYFMDPYTLGNFTFMPENELYKRWHAIDEYNCRLYNFGLILKSPYKPEYNPFAIKYLE